MHYLTACLIFKDSASYLREWLCFHLQVGFEHFYLYDNGSTDDYAAVIRPFVHNRQGTLYHWPGRMQQRNIYQHCLDNHRQRARWLACINGTKVVMLEPDVAKVFPNSKAVNVSLRRIIRASTKQLAK